MPKSLPGKHWIVFWSITVIAAFLLGIAAHKYGRHLKYKWTSRTTEIAFSSDSSRTVFSNLYNIRLEQLDLSKWSSYGAIDEWNYGILLSDNEGNLTLIGDDQQVKKLNLRIPINYSEFMSDPDLPKILPSGSGYLDHVKARFAVKDMLVFPEDAGHSLYASHHFWNADENCLTLRVSKTALPEIAPQSQATSVDKDWTTLFETSPCLPLMISGIKIYSEEAGGRLVRLPNDRLLLSVGDHGYVGVKPGVPRLAQDKDSLYGRTILLDANTGDWEVFTLGHRNPQGLTVASDGSIYLTEHGPTGGDELNLIAQGKNYGWPFVSYGRGCPGNDCSADDGLNLKNPINQNVGEHAGDFEKPLYAWVPSIGISNLIQVKGDAFELWKGDLLVTSLKQRTVFRVRIRDNRVVVVEPVVTLKRKIRDIIERADGTIVLKSHRNLTFLTPDLSRKQIVLAQCTACHVLGKDQPAGIGPNLWGVMGRHIASASGFTYSENLKNKGGTWTKETMRAFLQDPSLFAPGNAMAFAGISDPEDLATVIDFLESNK